MAEYITKGEFAGVMDKLVKKFDAGLKHYGAILDTMDTNINEMRGIIANLKPGGREAEFSFYQPTKGISADVNVFRDPRTGRPNLATVKGWSSNVDVLGEYDVFSVIGDFFGMGAMGWAYLGGKWDGKLKNYRGLSSNKDVINSMVELRYGPATELTDLVLEDRNMLRRAGGEIENYSVELENYGPEPVVNIDENGEMNFSFYSQPEADGNSSARISYENSSYEDNLIQNLEIPTTELSEVGEISYG